MVTRKRKPAPRFGVRREPVDRSAAVEDGAEPPMQVEPAVDEQTQPGVEDQTELEADEEAVIAVENDVEPDIDVHSEPEIEAAPEPKPSTPRPRSRSKSRQRPRPRPAKVGLEARPEPDGGPEPQTDPEPEVDVAPDTEPEPQTDPEPQVDGVPDAGPAPQTGPEPQLEHKWEPNPLLHEPPVDRADRSDLFTTKSSDESNETVLLLEREVGELRAELAAFVDHADTALARIERLLMTIRGIETPTERIVPVIPVQPTRGRGFVGGWRTRRE
jgi:hypothetical protein